MNIFISYSSKDFDIASKACECMEDNGFPCFIAPRNIRSGHIYAEEIIFGLKNSDLLLLMLSENSNASAHVMREVEWCVSNNVPILAYRLEEVQLSPSMEYFLMTTQWLDGMKDRGFEELLESLYAFQEDFGEAEQEYLEEEEMSDSEEEFADEYEEEEYEDEEYAEEEYAEEYIENGYAENEYADNEYEGNGYAEEDIEEYLNEEYPDKEGYWEEGSSKTGNSSVGTAAKAERNSRRETERIKQATKTPAVSSRTGAGTSGSKNSGAKPQKPKDKKEKKKGVIWIWIGAAAAAVLALVVVAVAGSALLIDLAFAKDEKKNGKKTTEEASEPFSTGEMDTEEYSEGAGYEDHLNDSFVLGSTVVLGTYFDEPIEWRVIHVNGDGTVDMITDQIISCKAFDGAESGRAFYDRNGTFVDENSADRVALAEAYGSNSWFTSDLRFWLNSDGNKVSYLDQPPTDMSMCDGMSGYDEEFGFLSGFRPEEKAAIVCTGRKISFYDPQTGEVSQNEVQDSVRLLRADELDLLGRANVDTFVPPTETATFLDRSLYYQNYCLDVGIDTLEWWLMEPLDGYSFKLGIVSNGTSGHEKTEERNPNAVGIGVRPVITVNPDLVPRG